MDTWACDFCGCLEPGSPCSRDEDCGTDQECVLDLLDPSQCCDLNNSQFCTDDLPVCGGTCERRSTCEVPGAMCADGRVCQELERDDCCPRALQCEAGTPLCSLLCL